VEAEEPMVEAEAPTVEDGVLLDRALAGASKRRPEYWRQPWRQSPGQGGGRGRGRGGARGRWPSGGAADDGPRDAAAVRVGQWRRVGLVCGGGASVAGAGVRYFSS
jgi:hypothetical protein